MAVQLSFAAVLAALAGAQDPAPETLPALVPIAAGELQWPEAHLVSRLLTAGDVDGDGHDDVWSARQVMRDCAFQTPFGGVDLIGGRSATVLATDAVRAATVIDVLPATTQRGGRLLRVHLEASGGVPPIEVRSLDGRRVHWSSAQSPIPLDVANGTARFLPSADGVSAPDVVVGSPSARRSAEDPHHGAVARLSGSDGTPTWVHWAQAADGVYGARVESAGDVDGDGTTDVAVCIGRIDALHRDPARRLPHVEFLSGADGAVIGVRPLEPARLHAFQGVGDLDGDRRTDFVLQTGEPAHGDGPPTWLVLSSSQELVPVLPEHELLWFTAWTAADGRAEVLVAVRKRSDDTKSLQIVTPEGARRFAEYPAQLSTQIAHVAAGDFDGDGIKDLAAVQRVRRAGVGYGQRLSVVPGSGLR